MTEVVEREEMEALIAGRKAEEKQREIVRLDIDLLACDGQVCRPDDWARDYVRRGLSELDRL